MEEVIMLAHPLLRWHEPLTMAHEVYRTRFEAL
jgi:hypothetical protein